MAWGRSPYIPYSIYLRETTCIEDQEDTWLCQRAKADMGSASLHGTLGTGMKLALAKRVHVPQKLG